MKKIIQRIWKNPLLKKAILDSNYYALNQFGIKFLNFLVIPILARLISVQDFGYYDTFILASGLLGMVFSIGMDSGIVIKITENLNDKKILSHIFTFVLVVNIFLWLVTSFFLIVALRLGFLNGFPKWLLFSIIGYALLYQVIYNIFNFLRWVGNAKVASFVSFITSFLGTIFGIVIIFLAKKHEIYYYTTGIIIGNIAGLLICLYLVREYLDWNFRFVWNDFSKDIFKLSIPFFINNIGGYVMQIVDRVLLGTFYGITEIGLYGLAYRIAQIPGFIMGIGMRSFHPVIYMNYDKPEGQKIGRLLVHLYVAFLVVITPLLALFSSQVIKIFGGNKFEQAHIIMPCIVLSVMINGLNQLNGIGFSVKRKTAYISYITLLSIILILLLFLIFNGIVGFKTVALVTLVSAAISSFAYMYYSEKFYRFGYNKKFVIISFLFIIAYLSFSIFK